MDNIKNVLLEIFKNNNIDFHYKFMDEFLEIINVANDREKIIKKFISMIIIMNNLGPLMCNHKEIESIKHHNVLYSLHITTRNSNLRILFFLYNNYKIFLHIFSEKQGKKVTEYWKHIPIAENRKKEFLSGVNL